MSRLMSDTPMKHWIPTYNVYPLFSWIGKSLDKKCKSSMIVNVWRVIIKKVELALPSSDQPVFVGEVQFCKSWSMEAKWVSTFRKIAPTNEKHSTKLDVYRDAWLSHQSDDFGGKIPLSVIWSDDVAPTSFFILLPFKTPAAALARNRWRLPGIPKWCIVSVPQKSPNVKSPTAEKSKKTSYVGPRVVQIPCRRR